MSEPINHCPVCQARLYGPGRCSQCGASPSAMFAAIEASTERDTLPPAPMSAGEEAIMASIMLVHKELGEIRETQNMQGETMLEALRIARLALEEVRDLKERVAQLEAPDRPSLPHG